jgi:hypothetical protein
LFDELLLQLGDSYEPLRGCPNQEGCFAAPANWASVFYFSGMKEHSQRFQVVNNFGVGVSGGFASILSRLRLHFPLIVNQHKEG